MSPNFERTVTATPMASATETVTVRKAGSVLPDHICFFVVSGRSADEGVSSSTEISGTAANFFTEL